MASAGDWAADLLRFWARCPLNSEWGRALRFMSAGDHSFCILTGEHMVNNIHDGCQSHRLLWESGRPPFLEVAQSASPPATRHLRL